MSSQQALAIIEVIDWIHQPYYWSFIMFVALAYTFEIYLPKKRQWESIFDLVLTYFKFILIAILAFIVLMQGMIGGCLCQIPQNYLARKYLSLDYWYPFGLVFRENFAVQDWKWLRMFYLIAGLYFAWATYQFWKKRIVKNSHVISTKTFLDTVANQVY